MVEFGDLQCPVCRAYAEDVLPTLVRQYVRAGKLRLVFRNISIIGPDSVTAARMAAAAGQQNRLWQYIALFYANQGQENSGYVNDAFLRQIGTGVAGLNVDRALAARGGSAVDGQLQQAEGQATQLGIDATPSFLLGRRGSALTAFDPGQLSRAPSRPPSTGSCGRERADAPARAAGPRGARAGDRRLSRPTCTTRASSPCAPPGAAARRSRPPTGRSWAASRWR